MLYLSGSLPDPFFTTINAVDFNTGMTDFVSRLKERKHESEVKTDQVNCT